MKKLLLNITLVAVSAIGLNAQELIVGGNMEDVSKWYVDGEFKTSADSATFQFNYTNDFPSLGSGGCMLVTGQGQIESIFYQAITIVPGHYYKFSGLIKNASTETITNANSYGAWFQVFLSRSKPVDGASYDPVVGDFEYTFDTWNQGDATGIDGKFIDAMVFYNVKASSGANDTLTSEVIFIPDTVSTTTWYVISKNGSYNPTAAAGPVFSFLYDEISLKDLGTTLSATHNAINDNAFSQVYPNVSNGFFTLKSSSLASYNVYNSAGMVVCSGELDKEQTLDLSSFAKGLYIINVNSGTQTESHKIVVE